MLGLPARSRAGMLASSSGGESNTVTGRYRCSAANGRSCLLLERTKRRAHCGVLSGVGQNRRRGTPGRRLLSDAEVIAMNAGVFRDPASVRRRGVLRETIAAFQSQDPPDRYHRLAAANLARWRAEQTAAEPSCRVQVHADDWGEGTRIPAPPI